MILQNNIDKGYVLVGRWKNHKYEILRLLGEGGIAKIYKVRDTETKEIFALKLSDDLQSITKEYEILSKYEKIEIFPRIKEMDDSIIAEEKLYYFVMEYIEGKNLKQYMETVKFGVKDILGLTRIIGSTFAILHKNKHVFGDLKLENLMIDRNRKILRIIDFGGVTPIGKGIKEYTPLYDRATWNAGLRRADENYDLFSLNMFIVNLLLHNTLIVEGNSVEKLVNQLETVDISPSLIQLIHNGLNQRDISFDQYMNELNNIYTNNGYRTYKYVKNSFNSIINTVLVFSIILLFSIITIFAGKSVLL